LAQAIMFTGVGGHTTGSILQITNWNGLFNGGGNDRVLFAGNAGSFEMSYAQNEVLFNGISGYNLVQFDGFYELTGVPEPSTWAAGVLAVGAIAWTQRRRFRQKPLLAPELPVA
jgi:MYXO-CTERM domain-containing protein